MIVHVPHTGPFMSGTGKGSFWEVVTDSVDPARDGTLRGQIWEIGGNLNAGYFWTLPGDKKTVFIKDDSLRIRKGVIIS